MGKTGEGTRLMKKTITGDKVKQASLSTLKHTGQVIGALIVVAAATWAFAEPAVKQYVDNVVAVPLLKIQIEQEIYRTQQAKRWREQTKVLNIGTARQLVLIEQQRIQEKLQAETRSDIKELLRRIPAR